MTAATNRNALDIDPASKERNNSIFAERIMTMVQLAPGATMLEVGCGGAELSHVLGDRYGLDCRGIEPFPMYAPTIDPNRVTKGVAERIEYPDNTFDLVVAKDVLEHVDDVPVALDELIRVSRKYVYVMCPNYLFPYEAHFKVPFPPLLPKPIAKLYLRMLGTEPNRIDFLDHINYITKPWLQRALRDSRHRDSIAAVIDLQLAKGFRKPGLLAPVRDLFMNYKLELLVIKKAPAMAVRPA